MKRTFGNLEEATRTWRNERERATPKSGIYCCCSCYMAEAVRGDAPLRECTLLLPPELYLKYEKSTREEDRDFHSSAHVAVLCPGVIRVRLYPNEKNNFVVKQELCRRSCIVDELLLQHLGKRVRLGKNPRIE